MILIRTALNKSFIALMIFVQVFVYSVAGFPIIVEADETTAPTTEAAVSPAPCPEVTGTVAPTGAAAHTFTFNAEQCIWENAYYTWSAYTKLLTPKYSTADVYNPDTNCWEHTVWEFVTSDDKYVARIVSTPATIAEQTAQGDPPPAAASATSGTGGELSQSTGTSTISSGNGTGSSNTIDSNGDIVLNGDFSNDVAILTTLDSNANSGDAAALFNTTVGDVGTGDAEAIANILNMIQSSWNPANGDFNVFSASLYNDYFGDVMFNPEILLGNGTDSNNLIVDNNNLDLTLNVEDNASIENNINLTAGSGDATANGNTTVGDVSTGDASAVANIINMINSMITAGDSFIGSINLYGDLNGDILLPLSMLEILLGNGTDSSNTIGSNTTTDVDIDSNTSSSITNNTDLTAASGGATANANTTVGDVSTGDASTNVEEMNLVGQNVTGSQGLLVFVNVLGSWVGMLFNSPTTATIAADNGTSSTNNITSNNTTDADVDINRNYDIVNNLNLNATSGNATANANTTVGNVSSGSAMAAVNLLNMIDSEFEMTDWFGVLFINVFGNWHGSFGVDTAAGDNSGPVATGGSGPSPSSGSAVNSSTSSQTVSSSLRRSSTGSSAAQSSQDEPEVLASNTSASPAPTGGSSSADDNGSAGGKSSAWWISGVTIVIGVLLLGGERLLVLFRKPQL